MQSLATAREAAEDWSNDIDDAFFVKTDLQKMKLKWMDIWIIALLTIICFYEKKAKTFIQS